MTALKQWAAAAPDDAHPWLKLFHIYLDLGWRAEAGQASQQALKLAPQEPRSQVARALFYYRSNDPAAGLPFIEQARRLDPTNANLANLHTTMLLKAARFADAEREARQLAERDPNSLPNRLLLAQALIGLDRLTEARALLQEVQARDPNSIEAAYQLGTLAQRQNDLPEAIRQFERVVQLEPQYASALFQLGQAYAQQGRREEGRRLQRQFQQLDQRTQEFETALARLEARPNDAGLHYRLAQERLAAGELPQAIVELRRVLELRPKDQAARRDLIAALRRHGRQTEAQQLEASGAAQ
jgi:superkiller protein 3